MHPDAVEMHVLYRETMNRLDLYARRVAEAKELQQAKEFASYLMWSGIIKLCKAYSNPGPALKCDGCLMEHTANALIEAVNERYRTNSTAPKIGMTELEKLNHKLDLIAGHMARAIVSQQTAKPELTVIDGLNDIDIPSKAC